MSKSPIRKPTRMVRQEQGCMDKAGAGNQDGPTGQTRRRRKPDWLDLMRRAGTIDEAEFESAVALRRGFEVLTTGAAIAQWDYRRVPGQRATGEWEPEYRQRYEERFNLWADLMDEAKLPVGPVLDVIVDGMSCRETDAKWRRRKGTIRSLLLESLALYRSVARGHAIGRRRGRGLAPDPGPASVVNNEARPWQGTRVPVRL